MCDFTSFQMHVRVLCTHSVMGKELFWIGLFVVEKLGVKIRKTRLKYAKLTSSSTQMGEKGLATLKWTIASRWRRAQHLHGQSKWESGRTCWPIRHRRGLGKALLDVRQGTSSKPWMNNEVALSVAGARWEANTARRSGLTAVVRPQRVTGRPPRKQTHLPRPLRRSAAQQRAHWDHSQHQSTSEWTGPLTTLIPSY